MATVTVSFPVLFSRGPWRHRLMAVQLPSQNAGDTSARGQVQGPSQMHSTGPEAVRALNVIMWGNFPQKLR